MVERKTAGQIRMLLDSVEKDTSNPKTYLDRCIAVKNREYCRIQDVKNRLIMMYKADNFMVARKGEEKSMLDELIKDLS